MTTIQNIMYTQIMATLQRHVVRGRTYWRIVESRRINGKPRAIPLLYLGSADSLLERLLQAPAGRLRIESYQHGDVAALKAAADQLGAVAIIDKHVAKQRRRISVGTTLLLAALNRAVRPRSKRGWLAGRAGPRSAPTLSGARPRLADVAVLPWDQMDRVRLAALRAIEGEFTRVVSRQLGSPRSTPSFMTRPTSSPTSTPPTRASVAARGHSKQKRSDLRLFGLALLVSRAVRSRLCSHVYQGNPVDCSLFPGFAHSHSAATG